MSNDHKSHIVPTSHYAGVFLALMVLTVITVAAARVDMGRLNDVVAMGIAVTKATLVVLIFMNVRNATKLTPVVIASGILFFGVMIAMTLADYWTRGWLGVAGR